MSGQSQQRAEIKRFSWRPGARSALLRYVAVAVCHISMHTHTTKKYTLWIHTHAFSLAAIFLPLGCHS